MLHVHFSITYLPSYRHTWWNSKMKQQYKTKKDNNDQFTEMPLHLLQKKTTKFNTIVTNICSSRVIDTKVQLPDLSLLRPFGRLSCQLLYRE